MAEKAAPSSENPGCREIVNRTGCALLFAQPPDQLPAVSDVKLEGFATASLGKNVVSDSFCVPGALKKSNYGVPAAGGDDFCSDLAETTRSSDDKGDTMGETGRWHQLGNS